MSQEFSHEASHFFLAGLNSLSIAPVVSFVHDWPENALTCRAKLQGWYLCHRLVYT